MINHTDLMPAHGDRLWLVQPREPLAHVLISLQRLFVTALQQTDGSKLAFSDGDTPFVAVLLVTTDCILVCRSGFIQPPQVAKTVPAFDQTGAHHPLRGVT